MSNVHDHVTNAVETAREAAQTVTTKVADFFQGNPFDTPIGRRIENATDAAVLATENWELNMEICDIINTSDEGGRDAIRAIRKRLQTQMAKNNATVMYTLTVLETTVKNCDQRFRALVCQREFVNDLLKLISSKHEAPQIIQERILSLIQSWADAFRGNPALSGVVELYDELKAKGVEFPAADLDSFAPIVTPKRTVYDPPQNQANNNKSFQNSDGSPMPGEPTDGQNSLVTNSHPTRTGYSGPINPTPEQMAKLRSELDVANINLTVLRELVNSLKTAKGPSEDHQLIKELYTTCKEMQKRIVDLIPIISNDEITCELLTINDGFNAAFEKYDRYASNKEGQKANNGKMVLLGENSSKRSTITEDDLIDLGGSSEVGNKISTTNLDRHLQGMDIKIGETECKPSTSKSSDSYLNEQTTVGLHTAAFNKTSSIEDRLGHKNDQNEAMKGNASNQMKNDDGL